MTLLFLASAQITLNTKKAVAGEQPKLSRAEPALPAHHIPSHLPLPPEAPTWVHSCNLSPANTVPAPRSWTGAGISEDSTQVC